MKEEFKLNYYFQLYKDVPCNSSGEFRDRFKKEHGEFRYLGELTIMVLNYQIKKYGGRLKYTLIGPSSKGKREGDCNGYNGEIDGCNRHIKRHR